MVVDLEGVPKHVADDLRMAFDGPPEPVVEDAPTPEPEPSDVKPPEKEEDVLKEEERPKRQRRRKSKKKPFKVPDTLEGAQTELLRVSHSKDAMDGRFKVEQQRLKDENAELRSALAKQQPPLPQDAQPDEALSALIASVGPDAAELIATYVARGIEDSQQRTIAPLQEETRRHSEQSFRVHILGVLPNQNELFQSEEFNTWLNTPTGARDEAPIVALDEAHDELDSLKYLRVVSEFFKQHPNFEPSSPVDEGETEIEDVEVPSLAAQATPTAGQPERIPTQPQGKTYTSKEFDKEIRRLTSTKTENTKEQLADLNQALAEGRVTA